ncbi:hypothetical protein ACKLNR_003335 [Fusarium oxysporum f. sp. zingiberi]
MVEKRTEDDTARRVQTEGVTETGQTRDRKDPLRSPEAKIIREPVFASHSSDVKGLTFHATAAVLCWTHERSTTQILAVHVDLDSFDFSSSFFSVLLFLLFSLCLSGTVDTFTLPPLNDDSNRLSSPCSLTHSHSPRVYLAPSLAI